VVRDCGQLALVSRFYLRRCLEIPPGSRPLSRSRQGRVSALHKALPRVAFTGRSDRGQLQEKGSMHSLCIPPANIPECKINLERTKIVAHFYNDILTRTALKGVLERLIIILKCISCVDFIVNLRLHRARRERYLTTRLIP